MKKNMTKILSVLMFIMPVINVGIILIGNNELLRVNLVLLLFMELANLLIMIYVLKIDELKKEMIIVIGIYIIISLFTPIYYIEHWTNIGGKNGEVGTSYADERYINVYGIKIDNIIDFELSK